MKDKKITYSREQLENIIAALWTHNVKDYDMGAEDNIGDCNKQLELMGVKTRICLSDGYHIKYQD